MTAYYNEIDPFAASWLRALINKGLIAPGDVDTRSITDVQSSDLRGYTQCHFFAGIGGWSLALRLADWPDDRPVWTGSCPCQPFSGAGKGGGLVDDWRKLRIGGDYSGDPRHLWPVFGRLIAECRPPAVFGEQVAKRAGRDWLTAVRADLEDAGYAVGAADLSAASVGAPHIRQRLYWVGLADTHVQSSGQGCTNARGVAAGGVAESWAGPGGGSSAGGLADADKQRRDGVGVLQRTERPAVPETAGCGGPDGMADAQGEGRRGGEPLGGGRLPESGGPSPGCSGAVGMGDTYSEREGAVAGLSAGSTAHHAGGPGGTASGFWDDCDWIPCADGLQRPVEPGVAPLVDGVPRSVGKRGRGSVSGWTAAQLRTGQLKGYGNAIVPKAAAAFVRAAVL